MRPVAHWMLVGLALLGSGCSNSGASCKFDGATTLAATTWPKFRADTANTGRACAAPPTPATPCVGIDLSRNSGVGYLLLPVSTLTPTATPTITSSPGPTLTPSTPGASPPTSTETVTRSPTATATPKTPGVTPATPTGTPIISIGPVETTPILGPDSLFIASADGNVYVLNYQGQPVSLTDAIQLDGAISGSPLLGADNSLFVPSNGLLTQFNEDGSVRNSAVINGYVASSPNIWDGDGTTFITSLGGVYAGVCPNGVPRYTFVFPQTQSSPAVVQDPTVTDQSTAIVVAGGTNGQVRAFNLEGRQKWSFFASADITAAILIDETTEQFYVADNAGRVFSGLLSNGAAVTNFSFATTPRSGGAEAPSILASLALGRDNPTTYPPRLYIADSDGTLYARDRATGKGGWNFPSAENPAEDCRAAHCLTASDPCPAAAQVTSTAILSSPAVATGGANDIIVFGVDGRDSAGRAVCGYVCAVTDLGGEATCLWSFPTGAPIGASSPSVGPDGTVYIGSRGDTNGGAVYAIGP